MSPRRETGGTLLEVLLALAILGSAGVALGGVAVGAVASESRAAQEEADLAAANRVIAAMSLLTRADLDRRLGARRIGEYTVSVQRPEPTLYRIAVARLDVSNRELLVTLVHRPETTDASQ